VVGLNFARWNHIAEWLRRMDGSVGGVNGQHCSADRAIGSAGADARYLPVVALEERYQARGREMTLPTSPSFRAERRRRIDGHGAACRQPARSRRYGKQAAGDTDEA